MGKGAFSLIGVLGAAIIVTCCDDAMSPRPWSSFAGKELHVRWGGTWALDTGLAIYQDGTAHAFVFGGTYPPDTLSHVSRTLNARERTTITGLIKPFPTFKSYYPGECWPDAGGTTLTLISDGTRWRVFVCVGSEGVPVELDDLGAELARIRRSLLDEEG